MALINSIWKVTHGGVVLLDFDDFTEGEPRHERHFIIDSVAALRTETRVNIGRKNGTHTASFSRFKFFNNDEEARFYIREHSNAISHVPVDCTFEWLRMGVTDTLINTAIVQYSAHVENNFFVATYTLLGGDWVYGSTVAGGPPPEGFAWVSPVTINHNKVPATQSDFPVLISLTDARFKSVSNGGHVESANGYDIRPYNVDIPLTFELESYDPTTGKLLMWVKLPSVFSSLDTVFSLAYGNTALTTNGSSAATWSNGFLIVMHLKDGTTLNVVDAVSGLNQFVNSGAGAAAGQIDGAASFVAASSQKLETPGSGPAAVAMTISAWVKATSYPAAYNCIFERGVSNVDSYAMYIKSDGKLKVTMVASSALSYDGTGAHTLATGAWYHVALTYSSTDGLTGYVDANVDNTVAPNGAASTTGIATSIGYPRGLLSPAFYWNGLIDEVRFSNVSRDADWLRTEFNNQSSPGTFETLGTESS